MLQNREDMRLDGTISDSTKLVHMNLPGTHDTSTCEIRSENTMHYP